MSRMNSIGVITGLDELTCRRILGWFASQAQSVQLEILERKRGKQQTLEFIRPGHKGTALELASLIMASRESGWADEQAFRSSRNLSRTATGKIKERREAKAKAYSAHRARVRGWLAKNWGKVMDIRSAGLSWRATAAMINDEYNLKISHTALYNYWRKWHEQSRV